MYINMTSGIVMIAKKSDILSVWPVRSTECGIICLPKTGQTVVYILEMMERCRRGLQVRTLGLLTMVMVGY